MSLCAYICVCVSTHYIKTHSGLCETAGRCWDCTPVSLPIPLKLLSCQRLPQLVTPGRERREEGGDGGRKTEGMPCNLQRWFEISRRRPLLARPCSSSCPVQSGYVADPPPTDCVHTLLPPRPSPAPHDQVNNRGQLMVQSHLCTRL